MYSAPQTTIRYSYDLNGNLKTQNITATGTTNWLYTWDTANHLMKATSNSVMKGTYAYDGAGRKVENIECACADIWFYAYRGTETLWQTDANWGSIDFLAASGMKIATVDSSVGGCFCTTKYYHLDPLGSTRLVTSPSKSVSFSDGYQPFGRDNGSPNTSENYKFTGKPYSSTTGLYYEYQRWYDPSTGRFISQDPLLGKLSNPQSSNGYVYANNVPTTYTDPSGLLASYNFIPPCWDWFAWKYVPCRGTQAGMVATVSAASPAGAAVVLTGVGAYYGLYALYSLISNYFKSDPPTRPPPPPLVPGGSDVVDPTPPTISIGIVTPSPGGTGSGIVRPVTVSQPGGLGRGSLAGDPVLNREMEWAVGLSNGYGANLRKVLGNPKVIAVCGAFMGIIAGVVTAYEAEESARQNLDYSGEFWVQWGVFSSICYGAAALLNGVARSF